MKQKLRSRLLAACIAVLCGGVMLFAGGGSGDKSYAVTDADEVSVIFTHDMHSHMDADRVSRDGKVVEVGGFGKLKTAMDEVKSDYPDSFVLDGGDFSMGDAVSDDFFQRSFRAENDEVLRIRGDNLRQS